MPYDIKQLRFRQHENGWCDTELAIRAGVAPTTVWNVMNRKHRRRPHPLTLKKIADALGVEPGVQEVA